MRANIVLTTVALLGCTLAAKAQDTLPHFQVLRSNGTIVVAFVNPYLTAHQINVERSHDSTRNFTTIYGLSDPHKGIYTFRDSKRPNDSMYYRLFIQLEGASYSFTISQRPSEVIVPPLPVPQGATPAAAASAAQAQVNAALETIQAPPVHKKPEWEPSTHVFTDDYGNVRLEFPLLKGKRYGVRFFDDQDHFLFELSDIREIPLTLEKVNFLHAGWFYFELLVDGVVQEKNKFLLTRDN